MMKKLLAAIAGLSVFCAAAVAGAVCDQTSASQADLDLWNVHGCWADFINYQVDVYGIGSGDWGNRGYNDACNPNLEYPKHWNASYLIGYGLLDDYWGSFHGTTDYENTAQRWGTQYHDDLYHAPQDGTTQIGKFIFHWNHDNEIQSWCPLFNSSYANATPGTRAGDFMHEGWHGWNLKHGYNSGNSTDHYVNPTGGACTMTGANCDWFYFHGVSTYQFGEMWKDNGTASLFHSPNQVQVEFLCDVADFHQWWVPVSVQAAASSEANGRSATRFINGPGYVCGDPRPW